MKWRICCGMELHTSRVNKISTDRKSYVNIITLVNLELSSIVKSIVTFKIFLHTNIDLYSTSFLIPHLCLKHIQKPWEQYSLFTISIKSLWYKWHCCHLSLYWGKTWFWLDLNKVNVAVEQPSKVFCPKLKQLLSAAEES